MMKSYVIAILMLIAGLAVVGSNAKSNRPEDGTQSLGATPVALLAAESAAADVTSLVTYWGRNF